MLFLLQPFNPVALLGSFLTRSHSPLTNKFFEFQKNIKKIVNNACDLSFQLSQTSKFNGNSRTRETSMKMLTTLYWKFLVIFEKLRKNTETPCISSVPRIYLPVDSIVHGIKVFVNDRIKTAVEKICDVERTIASRRFPRDTSNTAAINHADSPTKRTVSKV